jgi:hypothetical protein
VTFEHIFAVLRSMTAHFEDQIGDKSFWAALITIFMTILIAMMLAQHKNGVRSTFLDRMKFRLRRHVVKAREQLSKRLRLLSPIIGPTVHFPEDDYCQIQVLPISALDECRARIDAIQLFGEAHRDGDYFSNIYLRRDTNGLAALNLHINDIKHLLRRRLPYKNFVTTGYSTHVERAPRTVAFGPIGCCHIFFDFGKDGYVRHCWLTIYPDGSDERANLNFAIAALSDLAERADLIMVDWEQGTLLELKDNTMLYSYLLSRFDIFPRHVAR